mmetsp:Transcript_71442/g.209781  ORF Transcript_71442/g.209781 Transcript_71442/m.209781 type:complete len:363 (-) Transcript_71442:28-1116(-)
MVSAMAICSSERVPSSSAKASFLAAQFFFRLLYKAVSSLSCLLVSSRSSWRSTICTLTSPRRDVFAWICLPKATICCSFAFTITANSFFAVSSVAAASSMSFCMVSFIWSRMPTISLPPGLLSLSASSSDAERKLDTRSRSESLMSMVAVRRLRIVAEEVCKKPAPRPFRRAETARPRALTFACDSRDSFLKAVASLTRRPFASARVFWESVLSLFADPISFVRRSFSAISSLRLLSICGIFVCAVSMDFSRSEVDLAHWHMNLSNISFELLPSSATFFCIICSMVTTRRTGLTAIPASLSSVRTPRATGISRPSTSRTRSSRAMSPRPSAPAPPTQKGRASTAMIRYGDRNLARPCHRTHP